LQGARPTGSPTSRVPSTGTARRCLSRHPSPAGHAQPAPTFLARARLRSCVSKPTAAGQRCSARIGPADRSAVDDECLQRSEQSLGPP
jgi:hypothetical protein